MGVKFLKVAVVYFFLGVLLGMYMSMNHSYTYTGVHVHMSLLGWVSFAIAGLIYLLFPIAGDNKLAKVHFWLHNIGLPIMLIGLFGLLSGVEAMERIIPIGATLTTISILLFMVNVLKYVKREEIIKIRH